MIPCLILYPLCLIYGLLSITDSSDRQFREKGASARDESYRNLVSRNSKFKSKSKSKRNLVQTSSKIHNAPLAETKANCKISPRNKFKLDSFNKRPKSGNILDIKEDNTEKRNGVISSALNGSKKHNPCKDNTTNLSPERPIKKDLPDRPSTPSILDRGNTRVAKKVPQFLKASPFLDNGFDSMLFNDNGDQDVMASPMTVEVKPLPKIRLCLLPAPREEDEEESSLAPRRRKVKKKRRSTKKKRNKS